MAKKKIKKYKVGLDSETRAISLVSEPAIEIDFIHMSKDSEEKQQVLLEKNDKYLVYGPVLIPDKDIYRNNGEQEYYLSFTKESIEKMSQEYMKDFRQYNVSLQHEEKVDEVCVVESWIVTDSYKDKANALGFNVPVGTWMVAMKVNNIDTWNRIKDGELKGFSVESLISLEDFSKIENNNDNFNDMNEEMLFNKLTNWFKDFFKKDAVETTPSEEELAKESGFTTVEEYKKEVEAIKEELEEQTPTAEAPIEPPVTPTEPSKDAEPITTPQEENKAPEEPKNEPTEKDNHLEELINNLKEEIEALKGVNKDLTSKVKKLEAEPSAKPVNTNSKASKGDTYAQWRSQMKDMLGY